MMNFEASDGDLAGKRIMDRNPNGGRLIPISIMDIDEIKLAARIEEIKADLTFSMRIEIGSDEMCDAQDVAQALRLIADKLTFGELKGPIRDRLGSPVGEYIFNDVPV